MAGGDVEVAVKMIKEGAPEEERIKFLREAAINGQFHHLNVVRLLGVVTVGEPVSQYLDKTLLIENYIFIDYDNIGAAKEWKFEKVFDFQTKTNVCC